MIRVNPIHRRLAELTEKAARLGSYAKLSDAEQMDLTLCLDANLRQMQRLARLKGLMTAAQAAGDKQWSGELEQQAEKVVKGG